MNILRTAALFALALFFLFSCDKARTPVEPDPVFDIFVKNDYFEIQAKYALFLSNEEGETVAFRWLPSEDTAHVQVPGSKPGDRFDCTILKVTTLEAPGSGVKDTSLTLTTYTNLSSGQHINLRDLSFQQFTSLKFTLTGFTTLDSICVSDALALSRPQANNNYYGSYLVNNTGRCWMRVLVNGEHFWRFLVFKNVGETLDANTIDVSQLLFILSPPIPMELPFVTTWQYKLDGVVDTSRLEFFPLSEHIRAPGGAVPIYNTVQVFEPVNNDAFDPNRPYIDLFRLQTNGPLAPSDGYTYLSDNFYPAVPSSLPEPTFDLGATTAANNRAIAVKCIGDFDLLAFSRTRNGNPNINWEVTTKPQNGIVLYILPDVPKELGDRYPSLKNYDFNTQVRARAENYERLNYEEIVRKRLENADPLWQARGGYLGREESF
ncbi:MAG: hypothetical protein H7246_13880 [Phycisphaerae bacterium]|nr:hypothetical protein [Saprospiraceae bacterium]